jgi:hypothetical protein
MRRVMGLFAIVGALAEFGCGGNSVSGAVGGTRLSARDSLSYGGQSGLVSVRIASYADVCAETSDGGRPPGAVFLDLNVSDSNGVQSKSYSIGVSTGVSASAEFRALDAQCNNLEDVMATSGSISMGSAGGSSSASGSFDLLFGSDHLTGSFDAPACAGVSDNGPPPVKTCG